MQTVSGGFSDLLGGHFAAGGKDLGVDQVLGGGIGMVRRFGIRAHSRECLGHVAPPVSNVPANIQRCP